MDSDRSDVSKRTEKNNTPETSKRNSLESKSSSKHGDEKDEKKQESNPDVNQGKVDTEETEKKEEKKRRKAKIASVSSRFSRLTKLGKQPMFRKKTKVEKEKEIEANLNGSHQVTAYAFFVKSFFVEYKKRNPEKKINFVTLSRQCAEKWHELPQEIKKEFYRMATRANNCYAHICNVVQPKQSQLKTAHSKYIRSRNSQSSQSDLSEDYEERHRYGRPPNKDKSKVTASQHVKTVRIVNSKRSKFGDKGASLSNKVSRKPPQSYKTNRTAESKRSKGTLTEKIKKCSKGVNTPRLKEDNKSSFKILPRKKPTNHPL